MISYLAIADGAPPKPGTGRSFSSTPVVGSPKFATAVVELGPTATHVPKELHGFDLRGVAIVKTDSPMTDAFDGDYRSESGTITAHVETTMQYGSPVQYLHLATHFSDGGPSVEDDFSTLTKLLYQLMRGELNGWNQNGYSFVGIR